MTVKLPPDDSAIRSIRMTGIGGEMGADPTAVNPMDSMRFQHRDRPRERPGRRRRAVPAPGPMTAMDLCVRRAKRGPGDDELVWCRRAWWSGVHARGPDLQGEAGCGGRLSATPDGSWFTGSVQGLCETADMQAWRRIIRAANRGLARRDKTLTSRLRPSVVCEWPRTIDAEHHLRPARHEQRRQYVVLDDEGARQAEVIRCGSARYTLVAVLALRPAVARFLSAMQTERT